MLYLTIIVSALVISQGLLVWAILQERRDLIAQVNSFRVQNQRLSSALGDTLDILSRHYPLRNEKQALEALIQHVQP